MPRRELIEKVLSGLPAGSDSVAYPDHPLLLQGPDVLASVGGSLTAYFVQDQSVKNFPEKVLPKVMLSRLALPREASFVLVLNESTTLENEELPLFDEVVEVIKQGRQRMPAGRIVGSIVSEAVEHLREPHHERFAEAWTATIKGRRATRFEPGEPTSVYGIGSSSVYGIRPSLLESRYMDFQDGKFVFYPPEATKGKTLKRWLSEATMVATRVDYGLARGITGLDEASRLVASGDAHLAIHIGRMPIHSGTREFDVLKPLRTAAFAGFATKLARLDVI